MINKPFRSVAVVGTRGSGKTTLLSSITRWLAEQGGAEFQSAEALAAEAVASPRKMTFALVKSPAGGLEFIDAGGSGGLATELDVLVQSDVALVVHRADRDAPELLEQRITAARQLGVPWVCAFVVTGGAELPAAARQADRVVRAAAPDDGEALEPLFRALAGAPVPGLELEGPALLRIASIETKAPGVSIVSGMCLAGRINVGDPLELPGVGTYVVSGVLSYGKLMDTGHAGEELGLMLRRFQPAPEVVGAVLAPPGTRRASTQVTVELMGSAAPPTGALWLCSRQGAAPVASAAPDGARLALTLGAPRALDAGTGCLLHDGTRSWAARVAG